jgi:hypothetical protein
MEEGQIMGMELTDAEVEPYQTDGFVLRKALFDGVEVAYLRQAISQPISSPRRMRASGRVAWRRPGAPASPGARQRSRRFECRLSQVTTPRPI